MAKVFEALYSGGWCIECGDPIEEGEEITKAADGEIRHAECDDFPDYDSYFGYRG